MKIPIIELFKLALDMLIWQRNEHILTKIAQNKLFLQKCGIETKL
jgi:hypothetical protein